VIDSSIVVPVGWEIIKITELVDVIMGQSPPSNTYNIEKKGLPFFQGKAEFTDLHPTVRKWCSKPNKISLPNDILLSVRAPVGAVNIANVECCIGRGLAAIQYKHCPNFLFYFFKSVEKKLDEKGTGTTFRAISGETVRNILLPLPPLPEQHRIVTKIEELFSELDKGIESLKTAQQQLKIYRQSLLKHAFSGKLTEQWRADNQDKLETADALLARIQSEREERYQELLTNWEDNGRQGTKPKAPKVMPPLTDEELAELPELPEGWTYSYLADLGDLGRGKSKHRPRNDALLFGGDYPFIQTGEVKAANRIIRTFYKTYSEFGLQQSKLWLKGTLCITIAANIAETAFLGFDGCFPDSIVGFSSFRNIIFPEYVDFFMQSARTRIEAYAPATAQKNINLETLENLVVPFCSLLEQGIILDSLETSFSITDQLEQTIITALQQSEVLRQSILKKAFSGQLVEQDPNDEPASILLERIKAEKAALINPTIKKTKSGKKTV
jgi:type I restriction enzyme S subunit